MGKENWPHIAAQIGIITVHGLDYPLVSVDLLDHHIFFPLANGEGIVVQSTVWSIATLSADGGAAAGTRSALS